MKVTTESGRDRLPCGMMSLKMFKINHSKALVIAYLDLRGGLKKYTFNQRDIINQTDIGRTVVRQCLKELIAEGVLSRKGISFYKLNREKMVELYYTQDRSDSEQNGSDSDTDRSENDLSRSESDTNRSENGGIHSSVLHSSILDSKSIDSSVLDSSKTKDAELVPSSNQITSSVPSKNCVGSATQEKSQKHSGTSPAVVSAKQKDSFANVTAPADAGFDKTKTPRHSGVALKVPEDFRQLIETTQSNKLANEEAKKKASNIQSRLNNGNNVTEEEFDWLFAYRPNSHSNDPGNGHKETPN